MRITEKGQVTIPITLRRRYGLQRNVEVEFVADKDGIRIKKRGAGAANPFRALRGKGRKGRKRLDVDRYIESIRGR
jgi:AbrB family looped-hinge helix DNA binding protein